MPVTLYFDVQHRSAVLRLYLPDCNAHPRCAALLKLDFEKFIPIFLSSVHSWNRNFLSRWGKEESWVLIKDQVLCLVQGSGPRLQQDLGSHLVILAWLPSLQPAWLHRKDWNCKVRSKHTTIFSLQGQFSALLLTPQLHGSQVLRMDTVGSTDDLNHVS